ncbi:rhomboid family intramembrane serine protease [Bernardetia sp.]|uniref:rhomboid family intramembrane serine protease n=1 Tax=Bernardetia sp. TaxID=1937974 RepID=UPI0025C357AE|nr:rhomboid family intramembrane serine protease [Bernardetia sp.]
MVFSVSLAILVVTIIISVMGFNNPELQAKLLHNPFLVNKRKEYYRLLSSGFIHNGLAHLGFNMLTFFFFGKVVENVYTEYYGDVVGASIFLGLYLLSIILSDLPSFFKYKDMPAYSSLGASGGVSAIVFASILFQPTNDLFLLMIPIPIPAFILGALYVIYSYYQSKNSSDNINHSAHLYGAVAGFVISAILIPNAIPNFFEQLSRFRLPF